MNYVGVTLLVLCAGSLSGCGIGDAQLRLRTAIDAKQAELSTCYEAALGRNATASGDVQLWVHVEQGAGRVDAVEVNQTDVQDPALQACMQSVLTQVQLAQAPKAALRVAYVFRFTPAQ